MQITIFIKSSLFLLFLKVILSAIDVHSACNVCQENRAACVNLTHFYNCYDDPEPHTDQLFGCPPGLVCTDLTNICFQASKRPASCGDTSICDTCGIDEVFACTSRTTFQFCFGSLKPGDQGGTCRPGEICDASARQMCVDTLTPESLICDRDAPT